MKILRSILKLIVVGFYGAALVFFVAIIGAIIATIFGKYTLDFDFLIPLLIFSVLFFIGARLIIKTGLLND